MTHELFVFIHRCYRLLKKDQIFAPQSEMAFLLNNTSISSRLRSSSSQVFFLGLNLINGYDSIRLFLWQDRFTPFDLLQKTDGAFAQSRRGFHVELGAREKAVSIFYIRLCSRVGIVVYIRRSVR